MGKGTDKLYITHSEWNSSDAYSASAGANVSAGSRAGSGASFRRLPFNFCAASLQPFKNAVCTAGGTIFDVKVISDWLGKHGTNPVTGDPLNAKDLIRLNFARNAGDSATTTTTTGGGESKGGDLVDPVTFKVFTDNTHIVAVRHGTYANVFAWETVERMNIKAKMWRDLVDDVEFRRQDIITLQDPRNVESRELSQFRHLKDGSEALPGLRIGGRDGDAGDGEGGGINVGALGRIGEKMLRAKSAVERARKEREAGGDVNRSVATVANADAAGGRLLSPATSGVSGIRERKKPAPNAAVHTTGRAAASFTSTGLTPETSGERALLTDEEYLLKPKRVQIKGYARVETNLGDLTLELHTDWAPRAVWNFVRLAQRGFYDGVTFHRNLKGFMIQGGDPDGDGRGGASVWGGYFDDEIGGPLKHDERGVVSMANKGKNTNSSQFFVTYGPAPHLDRKHTIFGRLAGGHDVLDHMEAAPTDSGSRPLERIVMRAVVVFVDPFDEFRKRQGEREKADEQREEARRKGGGDDDRLTWTGKRIRADGTAAGGAGEGGATAAVGKYLRKERPVADGDGAEVDAWEGAPATKKTRVGGGGFGNFDAW